MNKKYKLNYWRIKQACNFLASCLKCRCDSCLTIIPFWIARIEKLADIKLWKNKSNATIYQTAKVTMQTSTNAEIADDIILFGLLQLTRHFLKPRTRARPTTRIWTVINMRYLFFILLLALGYLAICKLTDARLERYNAQVCSVYGYEPDCKTKLPIDK